MSWKWDAFSKAGFDVALPAAISTARAAAALSAVLGGGVEPMLRQDALNKHPCGVLIPV